MKTCAKCQRKLPNEAFNKQSKSRDGLRSYCRDCQKAYYYATRGPLTRNYGGGRYLKMKVDRKTVMVHRFVMEQKIGRPLQPGEYVHHINGDRKDNRPENLELVSPKEHSGIHIRGRKLTPEHKAKVSQSLIGNQNRKGIPHPPEMRRQISESMKRAHREHPECWPWDRNNSDN